MQVLHCSNASESPPTACHDRTGSVQNSNGGSHTAGLVSRRHSWASPVAPILRFRPHNTFVWIFKAQSLRPTRIISGFNRSTSCSLQGTDRHGRCILHATSLRQGMSASRQVSKRITLNKRRRAKLTTLLIMAFSGNDNSLSSPAS
jgi:hypothetical protein